MEAENPLLNTITPEEINKFLQSFDPLSDFAKKEKDDLLKDLWNRKLGELENRYSDMFPRHVKVFLNELLGGIDQDPNKTEGRKDFLRKQVLTPIIAATLSTDEPALSPNAQISWFLADQSRKMLKKNPADIELVDLLFTSAKAIRALPIDIGTPESNIGEVSIRSNNPVLVSANPPEKRKEHLRVIK